MKTILVLLLSGLVSFANAEDKKPDAKKAKPAEKAEKKPAQKTDAAIMNWVHDNKLWIQKK